MSLIDNPVRLHHLFERQLQANPERVLLHVPHSTVTMAQLAVLTEALRLELLEAGVRSGDRVMVVAENCAEHVALLLACSQVGAWSCGVNARMAPGEIAAFALKADARCMYFTTGVSLAAANHAQHHHATASAVSGLQRTASRLDAQAQASPLAEQVAAIIFTSGTTGTSKGVMISHAGLLEFARLSAQSRQLGVADRSYAFLPMTHIFGLGTVLAASLFAGASLVMRSQFEPADVVQALAHERVSQLQGPPTFFSRLLAYLDEAGIEQLQAPQLRYVYTGAGALDLSLKRRVEARLGLPLHHGYGLSEYAGSLHVTALGQHRDDTSAGLAFEGAQVQVTGAEGQALAAGQHGELWLRGRGLMNGYFRDPDATAQVMRAGGWYASGDIGYKDESGALFVVGRLKEMIIRSGFNVYPAEVEMVLRDFAAIGEAAVLGQPEDDGNEQILAFVTLKPGQALDRAALQAHLREQLSPYKRPAHIEVVKEFPMTHSGKILKRQLLLKRTV